MEIMKSDLFTIKIFHLHPFLMWLQFVIFQFPKDWCDRKFNILKFDHIKAFLRSLKNGKQKADPSLMSLNDIRRLQNRAHDTFWLMLKNSDTFFLKFNNS